MGRQIPGIVLALGWALKVGQAADQPQWGEAWSRNQVSTEIGLPETWDPSTGLNLRWRARLGTETHGTPVVAGGRVYIGTNNNEPRDPKHQGDRGVLMCFNEGDGSLLWQLVVPKRSEDPYFDWPNSGIASPPTVEGDRVYVVTNRGEVLCLDAQGMANGNQGPFLDEGRFITPPRASTRPLAPEPGREIEPDSLGTLPKTEQTLEPGPLDADILWRFDLTDGAGIWPHDGAHSSILIYGDHLYLNTGTGVDNTHRRIRRPDAPSLVVLDKHTGRLLAREQEGIGPHIFHSTWAAPSLGSVDGKARIFFAAGNGRVYGFDPLDSTPESGTVLPLRAVWSYDFDPEAPKADVHRFHLNKHEGPSNFYAMPVWVEGDLYLAGGGDLWWGKNAAWLKRVDASGTGDVTETATRWSAPLGRHVFSTPAVLQDLVFQADNSRNVWCFDRATGEVHWQQEADGEFWASPLVADGRVYIGSRRGDFWVFAASATKKILHRSDFGAPISATATAANGTLYIATLFDLFAFAQTDSDSEPK